MVFISYFIFPYLKIIIIIISDDSPHFIEIQGFQDKFQNNLLSKNPFKRHQVKVSTQVNYYGFILRMICVVSTKIIVKIVSIFAI